MERADTTADFMARHQAHDYDALIARWRTVAARSGFRVETYARLGEYDLHYVENRPGGDGIYISAGMHGDEAAPPWALLEWTETHADALKGEPFILFPCLNPWGLVNNVRTDERGRDMNRLFQDETADGIREWLNVVGRRTFRISVNLHEDYDAQGMYVYELNPDAKLAEAVLEAAGAVIPPDCRSDIDGSEAVNGVIRREITRENLPPLPGLPEAIYLHLEQSKATLTIESPSEFALCDRIEAHVRALSAALLR